MRLSLASFPALVFSGATHETLEDSSLKPQASSLNTRTYISLLVGMATIAAAARRLPRLSNLSATTFHPGIGARRTHTFGTSPISAATRPRPTTKPTLPTLALQAFRRGYADVVPPKPKRRRYFRWIWRLTYLSAFGGVGWIIYNTWQSRHPAEQFDPDPDKKTLVVLGLLGPLSDRTIASADTIRHRLGRYFPAQETRHGELQCHRHLTSKLLPLHASLAFLYHRHH